MCDADYRVRGHGKLCRGRQQRDRDTNQELFPKNLSHYFLFDGERWNDVSVGGVRENIKESVHILTGLSAYREARNHLKDMGSNSVIKKFRSEIKGSGAVYDNLEAERKKLERDIEKLRDEIEVLEVNIRNYEKKKKISNVS